MHCCNGQSNMMENNCKERELHHARSSLFSCCSGPLSTPFDTHGPVIRAGFQWVPRQIPMGSAPDPDGFRTRSRWVPHQIPMYSAPDYDVFRAGLRCIPRRITMYSAPDYDVFCAGLRCILRPMSNPQQAKHPAIPDGQMRQTNVYIR